MKFLLSMAMPMIKESWMQVRQENWRSCIRKTGFVCQALSTDSDREAGFGVCDTNTELWHTVMAVDLTDGCQFFEDFVQMTMHR